MGQMTVCPSCGAGVEIYQMPGPGQAARIKCEECEHVFWIDEPPEVDEDE